MRNRLIVAATTAMFATVTAAPLVAQARPTTAARAPAPASAAATQRYQWGPQILYHFEGEAVGVGGRFEYSLARLLGTNRVDGNASVNWFPGGVDLFELNYNIVYRFQTPSLAPYAGGGLNFAIASGGGATSTDLHLNAVGGLKFKPMGRVTPLIELRYTFAGGDALILSGGVLF